MHRKMRVLAARFKDSGRASAVRDLLRGKLPPNLDVDIAPLGIPGEESHGEMVLAGRFPDDQASHVAALVREAGGEIVTNVDESWVRPRRGPSRTNWTRFEGGARA